MTVTSLIGLLQKVEHKEAEVYLENSALCSNTLTDVVIEHDLISEEIVVILKKR